MKSNKENAQDIILHTNCKSSDADTHYLHTYEARPVRLQLDYLKAEERMKEYGVKATIVIFGSARTKEAKEVHAQLEEMQSTLDPIKDAKTLSDAEKEADALLKQSVYYEQARKLGQIIGKSGKGPDDCSLITMTGGGPGIMEAANRGAHDVGAKSIGLNVQLPHEQFPNPYITPELCFQFHYFAIRKLHFLLRAKSLVIFPGGFGTLDEMFEILTMIQTKKHEPMPIVFVGKAYWERLINFELLVEEYMIKEEDLNLFTYVETAEEAWHHIVKWHEVRGESLLCKD